MAHSNQDGLKSLFKIVLFTKLWAAYRGTTKKMYEQGSEIVELLPLLDRKGQGARGVTET